MQEMDFEQANGYAKAILSRSSWKKNPREIRGGKCVVGGKKN